MVRSTATNTPTVLLKRPRRSEYMTLSPQDCDPVTIVTSPPLIIAGQLEYLSRFPVNTTRSTKKSKPQNPIRYSLNNFPPSWKPHTPLRSQTSHTHASAVPSLCPLRASNLVHPTRKRFDPTAMRYHRSARKQGGPTLRKKKNGRAPKTSTRPARQASYFPGGAYLFRGDRRRAERNKKWSKENA